MNMIDHFLFKITYEAPDNSDIPRPVIFLPVAVAYPV